MNRPKLEDYEIYATIDGEKIKVKVDMSKFGYLKDLEKYCDELEKALDKVCEWVSGAEETLNLYNEYHTKEQWKEWALNDE